MISNAIPLPKHVTLQAILKNLSLGFIIIDNHFNIIEQSGSLFETLEFNPNEFVGYSLLDLFPMLETDKKLQQLFEQNLAKPITTPKVSLRVADGSLVYLRFHFEKIIDMPQALIICEEVTEEGELEQALRRSYEELHLLNTKMDHTSARLSRLLERFMPARVAQKIIHDEEIPFLGGNSVRECTILFTDMRNFTAFAEQVTPEETVNVLNKYFAVISSSIENFEGSIVQLIGDLLMATFNVPDDQPDHAFRACLAAIEIRKNLNEFKTVAKESLPDLGFGIGISTGLVTPSYIGSKNRFQYATVGDVTNVAYHLCSKARANQIIIAHSTLKSAESYSTFVQAKSLGEFQLKRRKKPLRAYDLESIE